MKKVEIFKGRYPYKTIEIPDKEAQEHLDKGKLLGVQGRYKEAIAEYKKALKLNPNFKQALTNLKFTYYVAGMELHDGIRKKV